MRASDLLEERIGEWRTYLRRRQPIHPVDVEELEDHLRNEVAALQEAGLAADEAFLVAVKRLGDLESLSREFAREYSERLWKQLVAAPGSPESTKAFTPGGSGDGQAETTRRAGIQRPSPMRYHLARSMRLVSRISWMEWCGTRAMIVPSGAS